MSTGLHHPITAPETIDEELDSSSNSLLDSVIRMCEEPAVSALQLPTFAEQSFTEHKIDLAPQDKEREARERALRNSGEWTELAQLLLEKAEVTASSREAATLLVEVAQLYWHRLSNPLAAEAIFAKAIEVEPLFLDAADEMERLASVQGQWFELITCFEQAAEELSESDPAIAGEYRLRLAAAFIAANRDTIRAFASLAHVRSADAARVEPYMAILEREIQDQRQLECMIAASHRVGGHERCARLLSRAIAMSQSIVERAYYHHSIAQIELVRSEQQAAEWHLQEALRLDPAHHEARHTLGGLYRERGEFRKAVNLLEEARACTTDAALKADYALEAAHLLSDCLDENTQAIRLYESALRVRPSSLEASLPVVDRYFQQERWEELEAVLDSLLLGFDDIQLEDDEVGALYLKAALCALKLEKFAKARDLFGQVLSYRENDLEASLGAAKACLALSEDSQAIVEIDRAIGIHQLYGHTASEMIATLALSAQAHLNVGKQERALSLYQICVEHGDVESMGILAEVMSLRGEHHKAVELNLKRAALLDNSEKVTVLCEISDALFQTIGDSEAAIDVCWQALSVDKQSREVLHRLAVIYTKTEKWRDAIKTILRMASLESSALRRARYLQAAGTMAATQEQTVEAVALLNKAMDGYGADTALSLEAPTRASTFECFNLVIESLSRDGEWRKVEENYRKMICRLEPGDPEVGGLWNALGAVYRDKLNETAAAIDSYEVASSLEVGSLANHRVLVDLYEGAGSDQLEKAISRRRILLEAEPHNAEHYKALRGLYVRTRQMDRVWCMCRALDYMGVADDRELGFFRRSLPESMAWPTRPLNSEMWGRLRDPSVDANVSRIFGLISEIVALEEGDHPGRLPDSGAMSPQFEQLQQLFSAVSYVFGISGFNCVIRSDRSDAISLVSIRQDRVLQPSFLLGRELYEGRRMEHIVNGLGRFLFYGRRSYYLRLALRQPNQLQAAFHAALSYVRPDIQMPKALEPYVSSYKKALDANMHPTWANKLRQAVEIHLNSHGATVDVEHWSAGVDATARNAALLLSADLKISMASLSAEPGLTGSELSRDKTRLLLASVSEAHMALRSELGIAFADV